MKTFNSTHGSYYNNAFIIELPKENKILTDNLEILIDKAYPDDLATFLHEYFHYQLNISTFVRYRDIYLEYCIKALFSRTLDKNGLSNGNFNLDEQQIQQLNEYIAIQDTYDGYYEKKYYRNLTINDIVFVDNKIQLKGKEIPYDKVILKLDFLENGKYRPKEVQFGNIMLEEALCRFIEYSTTGIKRDDIEDLPYKVFDLLLRRLSIKVSSKTLVYLGLMSMLTTNAPYSFIQALKLIEKNQTRKEARWDDDDFIVNTFKNEYKNIFLGLVDDLKKSVREIDKFYEKRGITAIAVNYYFKKIIKNLEAREKNLCFDLDILFQPQSYEEGIQNLVQTIEPCSLLLLNNNNSSSELVDYDKNEYKGVEVAVFTATYKASNHFVLNHVGANGFIDSNLVHDLVCPWFSICTNTHKKADSICEKNPWMANNLKYDCLYGHAVGSVMGTFK